MCAQNLNVFVNYELRKVESVNLALLKGWQEATEGFEVIANLKLQVENRKIRGNKLYRGTTSSWRS